MLGKLHLHLVRLSIFLITAALIAGMVGCVPANPPSQDLEIRTWYDLDAIRNNLAGNHKLMNNLDSTTAGYEELASPTANDEKGWQLIGSEGTGFTGTFNGQGYEIRDVFINRPDVDDVGLFGCVYHAGIIKDIGVVNSTVIGNWGVGGLVGVNYGTVSDSYYSGNVTGNVSVGGLVGWNHKSIVSNSYYNYDEVLINGEKVISIGALSSQNFDQWLANDKFLDINERLSQEDGYYLINDVTDFKQLLAFGQDNSLKFRLKNDLDLATEPNFYIPYLAGEFDGNGHKISDLSFNFGFVSDVGLFGYLAPGGKVTEVGVENVNITGPYGVGGLVGYNHGTISNSYSTGSVSGGSYVGSLVGWNYEGDVSNSHATGSVTGEGDVGGLVGSNYFGTVSNSYSTGTVTGTWGTGGVVGHNWEGTVINSYSTGSVTGASWVGGLVGYNYDGAVSNSYSTGTITGGTITGTWGTGGVAGGNTGTVSNSYSTGNVSCDELVGGLVGLNAGGSVSNSYSTGSVTGTSRVGGLVGDNWGTVSNSFWDTETSGQATSDGGTGQNTTEMQDIITFSGAGWNIIAVGGSGERNPSYIWNIVNDATYPFLSWQPA